MPPRTARADGLVDKATGAHTSRRTATASSHAPIAAAAGRPAGGRALGLGRAFFFLESTFIDQNNPKRQTAGPHDSEGRLIQTLPTRADPKAKADPGSQYPKVAAGIGQRPPIGLGPVLAAPFGGPAACLLG